MAQATPHTSCVVYCYPIWHRVSFSLIAKRHVELLRRRVEVCERDELEIPNPPRREGCTLSIHPLFYIMLRWIGLKAGEAGDVLRGVESLEEVLSTYDRVVGFDVADSDEISQLAVELTELVTDVVVPSTMARDVYRKSGVKARIHVVPHGVPRDWVLQSSESMHESYSTALSATVQAVNVLRRKGVKVLLFWLWHSPERKGWPEVVSFYDRLRSERKDVVLLIVSGAPLFLNPSKASELGIINVFGWLNEREKALLYDTADLTLLFSRGGGFEICGLESLARGTPVIAHRKGAWIDYMPQWLLVKEGEKLKVFENNMIHTGYGYTVDVEDALNLAHRILDNPSEWKARVREYAERRIMNEYVWDAIGDRLADALLS